VFLGFKSITILRAIATKALGEIVESTLKAVGTTLSESEQVADLAGKVSKDLVDTLLERTKEAEKSLDKLIREPLLTGLRLMSQGIAHENKTPKERSSRDLLLDEAHVFLTRALALAGDSREDSFLVLALDCVVLAAHRAHRGLAKDSLTQVKADLGQIEARVVRLKSETTHHLEAAEALERFTGGDPNRDKPVGHPDQLAVAEMKMRRAKKFKLRYEEELSRLEILRGLVRLAERFLDHRNEES